MAAPPFSSRLPRPPAPRGTLPRRPISNAFAPQPSSPATGSPRSTASASSVPRSRATPRASGSPSTCATRAATPGRSPARWPAAGSRSTPRRNRVIIVRLTEADTPRRDAPPARAGAADRALGRRTSAPLTEIVLRALGGASAARPRSARAPSAVRQTAIPRRSSGHIARVTSPSPLQAADRARERALAEMHDVGELLHARPLPALARESLEHLELAHPQPVRSLSALSSASVVRAWRKGGRATRRRGGQLGVKARLTVLSQATNARAIDAVACIVLRMTSSSPSAPRWDARLWGALILLCGVLFLDGLDVSMVGVALPSIQADLGLTTSQLQWVVSGYVLGYGGLLLLGGRMADLLGRRRVLVAGLARLHPRVARRRHRRRRHAARADALPEGRERGVHRPRRPLDHHHDLHRGPGAQPRAQRSTPRPARAVLARARVRRPADRARLALDVPAARAGRAGDPVRDPAADPAGPAAARRAPALRLPRRGHADRGDAAARAHDRATRPTDGWGEPRRSPPSRSRSRCWPRSWRSSGARRTRWSGSASCARLAGAGEPRDGAVRRLRRLPVRRHAVPAAHARLVGAAHRARVPPRRADRRLRRAAHRAAGRPLRHRAADRRRRGGVRRRLRAVPARRRGALRADRPADDAADRHRLRALLPGAEHPGDDGRGRPRAGPRVRARAHVLPGRRRARAGRRQRDRQRRAATSSTLPHGDRRRRRRGRARAAGGADRRRRPAPERRAGGREA